jgi:hypothetical protein
MMRETVAVETLAFFATCLMFISFGGPQAKVVHRNTEAIGFLSASHLAFITKMLDKLYREEYVLRQFWGNVIDYIMGSRVIRRSAGAAINFCPHFNWRGEVSG